ncbi:nucleoside-diphosphate sugar epimerase/dehydratase [Lacticigenium naphthae]|uniref:nucleoside-diphosphate sugar epimerase/dehydratase n=1 Tax=Lacticigenium naphthae TaxID=515351 RepID=UPI0004012962|nr:nucleoside-diphosphate sugar epimerase/dehydratase [Lacticigenium naphthae]
MKVSQYIKTFSVIGLELILLILSGIVTYTILVPYVDLPINYYFYFILNVFWLYTAMTVFLKISSSLYRYTSLKDMIRIFLTISISFTSVGLIGLITNRTISIRFIIVSYMLFLLLVFGEHVLIRLVYEKHQKKRMKFKGSNKINTLVVGAGEGGKLFIQQVQKNSPNLKIIGVVDDEYYLQHKTILGVPIIGNTESIPRIVAEKKVDQISIAIPSLKSQDLERIYSICKKTTTKVNLIPSVEEVMEGKLSVQRFREIDIVELLGRDEVTLDTEMIKENIRGNVILVSGAGGSIGSEICRILCSMNPQKLILLGHGENSIYKIQGELNKAYVNRINIVPIIADIQDKKRIMQVMRMFNPDVVYHAAAHKHVPMMESNPYEAIKNNVIGTKNMAEAAKEVGVDTFVMISTDKAVNPPNVMGATKRIAEMIVTSLNEPGKTKFTAVRFGNVLGSRGSVVPLFSEQISSGGPVTVTDKRMMRYFMTIPEASRLVIQAGTLTQGGEIFVLDMGKPVKIVDLAKRMIKLYGYSDSEISIVETGIRPGEKLYEELLVGSEKTGVKVYDKIFVGRAVKGSIPEAIEFLTSLENEEDHIVKAALLHYSNEILTDNEIQMNTKSVVNSEKKLEAKPVLQKG